ncbi:hypothetical protein PV04_00936 [Phialophora macrospora]|uniref:Uncharacterized protein n=1 Tax=Phialophora macrospora TaxID=1851006 RepID=A0A0D2D575_9EURO|nr:hypothetical protein PV04_00936 [Phialophora macrospora]
MGGFKPPFRQSVEICSDTDLAGEGSKTCPPGNASSTQQRPPVLSTIYVDRDGRIQSSEDDIHRHLVAELDLSRLNDAHHALWWTGRPVPARPLHRQRTLGREIVPTEQFDLHLVWSDQGIFVKPLAGVFLNHAFWQAQLCGGGGDVALYENARGLLLSYVWLVRYEIDLALATEARLLPRDTQWAQWQAFVRDVLRHVDPNTLEHVNRRFAFGELRLNRLNQIYRLSPRFVRRHLLRGYGLGYKTYGSFFNRSFGWLIIVFAFLSTVLSALQVGLATGRLVGESAYQALSVGFACLCITIPVVFALAVAWIFVAVFLVHLFETLRFNSHLEQRRLSWKKEDQDV